MDSGDEGDGVGVAPVEIAHRLNEVIASARNHPLATQPPSAPSPKSVTSIDTATLELLSMWKADDFRTDPEKLRQAGEELAEFKNALNENRAATGARLRFG